MVVNYISVQDEDNWDVISQICYGSGGTTEYLLDDGSNPNAIKFGDNGAEERQLRLFNLLLGAGWNIMLNNLVGLQGSSPIIEAVDSCNTGKVVELLETSDRHV